MGENPPREQKNVEKREEQEEKEEKGEQKKEGTGESHPREEENAVNVFF